MDAVYTHGHHESVLRSHRWRTAGNSAAYLLPHLLPHMSVLDVGSGPGTITADLATLVRHVTASEVTAEALELARAEVTARKLANVDFAVADVQALHFADDTFCVVHAHQVLQHVGDPVAALREMRRVTKPGGIVAARDSDYAAFAWYPRLPALDDWMELYQRMARGNGGEPDAGRRLLSWARAAGFDDVTATASVWCFATPEDRAWWGDMWAERVLRSQMARQALDRGAATEEDLLRMSEGWREWAAAGDGWMSITHGEVLCRA
ncbi:class I SAM-dependent methyltransferase [Nonomuraea sp. NPDC047897]|uniref:class I SAM-dependent methyltransferase n=1 Tax=Nonomuraea sp. NPDC047897 TaxID=3364346 RepID=UPI00371BBC52